ncbi:MAG: DNA-protecting protein DprA [Saprospiraceae bacterium]|nr:DNA-protecting protein DprA [Saprospiraceae bacterium]
MNDLLYKIAITRIPLVGAVTAKTLISYCGSVDAVFAAKKRELLKIPGIGERIAASVLQRDFLSEAESELHFIEKNNINPIFYLDEDYPERLRHYHDSPIMLYCKGNLDLNAHRTVGIVGTRQPSPQGVAFCEEIVEGLKPYDVLLISGLAYGIDIAAHRKCVELDMPTLGILGHGFHTIYPASHRNIAEKMIQNGGLITEYPSDTKPDKENFPMRNRIIAGLCDALIVVETGIKGGSMITAHMANEYNKDVFAVPGRVKDKLSQGCNHLIKAHKALLLESADDIAYILRWEELDARKQIQQQLFIELSDAEKIIVNLLQQTPEASIDKLMIESSVSGSEMASLLLNLEFKGVIKSLPGKRYALL